LRSVYYYFHIIKGVSRRERKRERERERELIDAFILYKLFKKIGNKKLKLGKF